MIALQKLNLLVESYPDSELDPLVTKLLDVVLGQYRLRMQRYTRELQDFESRYELASSAFYRRFEAGELGDAAEFFEWAGLYELREDLARKIERMETAA